MISDYRTGDSAFDVAPMMYEGANVVLISVNKCLTSSEEKEAKRTHVLMSYYFCRVIGDSPNTTLVKHIDLMNPSLKRFDEEFIVEATNNALLEKSIFQYNFFLDYLSFKCNLDIFLH